MMEMQRLRSRLPALLGGAGVSFALLGFLAWFGYGAFAMRAIRATISHDSLASHRAAACADGLRLAQMLLGISAVLLGGICLGRAEARSDEQLGRLALWVGAAVLALSFLLI
jgi:hypothetical protein